MATEDLVRDVTSELEPVVRSLGYEVVDSQTFDSFDNAQVILQGPESRVRVARERGQILVSFGPPSKPNIWFDSDIVLEHLGLTSRPTFRSSDTREVLRGVAAFLQGCRLELQRLFDSAHFERTQRDLKALMEKRAQRLFGWNPPGGEGQSGT